MKRYLVAGLLTWLPLAITIWVLLWLIGVTDSIFGWFLGGVAAVAPAAAPAIDMLKKIPALSVIVLALAMLVTGIFVTNVFGQWWVRQWDKLMHRIPIVKSIYSSVKQVSDTLFSSSGNAFREAVLVQYPREGVWTVAFVTGRPSGEVADQLGDEERLSVYVPTTPNPTSGFFLIVRRAEVKELAMSVDQALKYVISMGVVMPAGTIDNVAPAANDSRLPPSTPSTHAAATRNPIG
jgi:uncharacterized membrane protein